MIESKTKNMGAYLRKMAIDGYIVNTDTHCNLAVFVGKIVETRLDAEAQYNDACRNDC